MTDKIDLDDIETGDEDSTANDGDWFWGEGEPPADGPEAGDDAAPEPDSNSTPAQAADDTAAEKSAADSAAEEDAGDASTGPIPHVPRANQDRPAGIPVEQGGSGAGAAQGGGERPEAPADKGEMQAAGPHGNDADEMTTAFTLAALRRIDEVGKAVSDAGQWSDWVGIVGDVEAHEIQHFQREHGLDVDFFNGTGSGPAERLAGIDPTSMFYAERMVVVGTDGESWVASAEEWEFVPLAEAAEGAGWTVVDGE